jgi:hypothetical protein
VQKACALGFCKSLELIKSRGYCRWFGVLLIAGNN